MPTFTNPFNYASPIGDAVAKLGGTLTNNRISQAQQIYQAEEALKLKNAREGNAGVASAFSRYGTPDFDPNAARSAAIMGGMPAQNFDDYLRGAASNTYGATDPRAANAFVGAGGAYGSTGQGFLKSEADRMAIANQANATERYKFDAAPKETVDASGNNVWGTNTSVVGKAAPTSTDQVKAGIVSKNWANLDQLTPAQSTFTGSYATPGELHTFVPGYGENGVPVTARSYTAGLDAQGHPLPTVGADGAPLAAGRGYIAGNGDAAGLGMNQSVRGDLQKADLANQSFSKMLAYTEGLVKANPGSVGMTGAVKGVVQDATQLAENMSTGLGFHGVQDAVAAIQKKALDSGVSPGAISSIFDPSIPKLSTAYGLLVYSAASALAGQQGRNVSDKDIAQMKQNVGTPESLFESQPRLLAKLGSLRDILGIQQGVIDANLHKKPAAAATPAPATGGVVNVTTPDEALKLPPGTQFRTPDGRVKVRP